jgi:transcriptional regulator of met regulon
VIFSDFQRLLYTDAYFRALQNGEAKNTRIPVIIVGQDRGGKTSLKKHLLGQDFDPEELSTDGIKVDVVELTDKNAEDPWRGKETPFLTSAHEADEHVYKCSAKLVTTMTEVLSSKSNETLTEEKFDKIDKLRKNVNSESPSTTVFLHDFAGQSIFYDTHFCFLKMLCPYLLVVDISFPLDNPAKSRFKFRDSERDLHDPFLETNLDYLLSWLTVLARLSDVICSEISSASHPKRYKLPPVVIALTNSDKCEAKYIEEVKKRIKDELRKKTFPNVFTEQIHVIDNTLPERNNHEIRKLRRHLYDLCKEILEQQSLMPVRWLWLEVELGDKMLKERLKHITLEECRKVAKFCKVDDVDSALDFLHNRGIIVHHKKSQVVVLDPRWLMDLFIQIITVPEEQNRDPIDAGFIELLLEKGILMKEYLEKKVDREHQVLEELMKQFSLLCVWNYEEGSDVQEQLSKSPNAYIVPSVAPLLKKGRDVQTELSESPIASVLFKFNLGYVPIGFYTRFQTTMIKKWVEEKMLNKTPELFSNFTRLILNSSEGYFYVYLIKIPAKIKVGVVPRDESQSTERTRANRKFVGNLKRVLQDCTQRVKEEEPLIYRNVTASLEVKCSCTEDRPHRKRRHSESEKTTSSIGKEDPHASENLHDHFWPLEELQTCTEDFPCPHGSMVKPETFFLDRVRPWLHPGTTLVSLILFTILVFMKILLKI